MAKHMIAATGSKPADNTIVSQDPPKTINRKPTQNIKTNYLNQIGLYTCLYRLCHNKHMLNKA